MIRMNVIRYKNRQYLWLLCIVFSFAVIAILSLYHSMLFEPFMQKEVVALQSSGTILYGDFPPPTVYIVVNPADPLVVILNVVRIIFYLLAIATTIISFIKWYLWRRKYGKVRTPIVLPMQE